MTKLRVLIVGAGVAGISLAFWLSRAGHKVTIVERSPALRTKGLQVDLRGYGIEVLRRMGLEEAFRAHAVSEEGIEFVNKSGRRMSYFPVNKTGTGLQSFTTDFEIMRGNFVRLLHEATRDTVEFRFGTTVASFEQDNGLVDVIFSDGKKGQFDLLVGADGQGSETRKRILDPNQPDPIKYLDSCIGYFTISRPMQSGERYIAKTFFVPGSRSVMTRRSDPHELQVYMSCPSSALRLRDVQRGGVAKEKAALTALFDGAGWQTKEILESLQYTDNFYCERPGLVKMDCWSKGHVTLVGDAAYSPTVNTGMGTTCGVVGAYILAGEITKQHEAIDGQKNYNAAMKAYEQKFRPFMDQVQRGIAEDGGAMAFLDTISSTSIGLAILHFILWLAALLKYDILSQFILRENVKDWLLPEYAGLHFEKVVRK